VALSLERELLAACCAAAASGGFAPSRHSEALKQTAAILDGACKMHEAAAAVVFGKEGVSELLDVVKRSREREGVRPRCVTQLRRIEQVLLEPPEKHAPRAKRRLAAPSAEPSVRPDKAPKRA
jgi:hypothetical protein